MHSWAYLQRRTGPFLLTNGGCRYCNFWYISSICWADFSVALVSLEFIKLYWISPAIDHQTVTMIHPPTFFFFWCKFGFGKCFGASSWTSHWASHSVLPYKIHLSHITIRLRNDSLLYRIRVDDTSKWQIFQFVVISQGTHLLSFFTFPICFTYQTSIEWSTLSLWATSQVVVRGSTLMILSVGHCQLPMAGHYASHFQSSHFLCKTSWITLRSMFINSL